MKFYDTCSLLLLADDLIEEKEQFIISSITLNELERIKISNNKDPDIKFTAHKILTFLNNYPDNYIVKIFTEKMIKPALQHGLIINDDIKILMSAYDMYKQYSDLIFISNDLSLRKMAELFFPKENINFVKEDEANRYTGYKEVQMSEEEMSNFYLNLNKNAYNLYTNEYLVIRDENNNTVDTLKWNGTEFKRLVYGSFNSRWFGDVKPIKGDVYQAMVCDSFLNNQLTMVKGPAGAGKSWLSIGYLIHLLERGKIDKIIIFCNTIAAKNAAKLGFYPGSKDEKLLDSQIGNMLISKFGGRIEVERMIEQEQLLLLPFADIRGFDTNGMNAGIYITEAQNLDTVLMKLALQRIGKDSICIIDGDDRTQVDDIHFAGSNNGMRRVSNVFRGEDVYGEVELKNIYRSKIAKIAEKL